MKITREIVREGARQQFMLLFDLSARDAQKAADELVCDEALVEAAIKQGEKQMEIAARYGWEPPPSLRGGESP